mmetsp:Transcript_29054/g.61836  ORF Transcript_29054/g.61836 Transcript_29054/m.61836 type:complete len:213 (+) Transcript_29054:237-875(+)
MPPKNQCYLSKASLDYLKDDLTLPIDKEEFERPLKELLRHAHQIAWILSQRRVTAQCDNIMSCTEYEDIEPDCLMLIRQFLEIESIPPIRQIVDAIPTMADLLNNEYKMDAASSLKHILERGTKEHRKIVLDAGVIPSFSRMLDSSNGCIIKVTVLLALVQIVTGATHDEIEAVVKAGAIHRLIDLLHSNHDVCAETSLRVLAIAAKITSKW